MEQNRPRGREKNVTGQGAGVNRRGSGTGQGQVGSGSHISSPSTGSSGGPKRSGGSPSLIGIIIAIIVILMGGGGAMSGLLGGGSDTADYGQTGAYTQTAPAGQTATSSSGTTSSSGSGTSTTQSSGLTSGTTSSSGYGDLSSLFGGYGSSYGNTTGWATEANTGVLNTRVSSEARSRYTTIKGDGTDTVTIMVYMCGTDLESRSGMATNDLMEMTKATTGDNVNLIVYTGGCKAWKNNVISSTTNQIYQVKDGGLRRLAEAGSKVMTDPATLTEFIQFCNTNFPANRNELIFWDHGGGSLSGYGYDEKNASSGSMDLSGINTALKNAGVKFDFIGFDACLMATIETALVLDDYADYMIASEETEPGVGWYYTNWLTELSENTAKPTIEVGKRIVDDFVDVCARSCAGQATTLSVVDLAELGQTVTDEFSAFSKSTTELIKNNEYKTVSNARYQAREFAKSSAIDQIDLVNFAKNLGTDEGNQLANVLLSAVKYNRTSSSMTNAYGISVYFPYKKANKVNTAIKTYQAIGLDEDYTSCIRAFASMEVSGQVTSGGTSSPVPSLFGDSFSGTSFGGTQSADEIYELLSTFLGGGSSSIISGLSSGDLGFFDRSVAESEDAVAYLADNQLDAGDLHWVKDGTDYEIRLTEDEWDLIQQVDLNLYYDDGEGYVDLGLDNVYGFDEDGNLVADVDGTWLSINDQPVAYYHTSTIEDGESYTITGTVPAMLNNERVNLVLIFNDENPYGYIAGADPDYDAGVTETVSRGLIDLVEGDTLDFLCDFYTYDGVFRDSYYLGEPMTVTDDMQISNTILGDGKTVALYRFTDIYNQNYWTSEVPQ